MKLRNNPNWMWCRCDENWISVIGNCYNDRREKGDRICPYKDCPKKEEKDDKN